MKILLFLLIAGLAGYSWADTSVSQHERLAKKRLSKKKTVSTSLGGQAQTRNLLYPFVLRVLYTPSYRLLSQHGKDVADDDGEIVQIFPFAGGIEGEVLFNNLLSLSLGGNFVWVDPIVKANNAKHRENSLKEINLWSSFYCNVKNYFKVGVGLTFNRRSLSGSEIETDTQGTNHKEVKTITHHTMSAHLDLRRDFFFTWGGFGVGLNIAMPFVDSFNATETNEFYEKGELKKSAEKDIESEKTENKKWSFFLLSLPRCFTLHFSRGETSYLVTRK